LKSFFGSIGLFSSHHLDKAETARFSGMGIQHDRALVHLTILGEEPRDIILSETRMNASHEEIGTWVLRAIVLFLLTAGVRWWRRSSK